MISGGKRNRRVTIQTLTPNGQSASGAPLKTFVDGDTVWANVKGKSGQQVDLPAVGSAAAYAIYTIEMLYRTGISPATTRLKVYYDNNSTITLRVISAFDPEGARRRTLITAAEVTA